MGTHYRGSARGVRALDTFVKLVRAANAVHTRLDRSYQRTGLSGSRLGVLEALFHLGPLQQHELGRKLLVSRANVTLVVDSLSEQGLVRREREETDRRCVRVHLTTKGRHKIAQVFPEHVAEIEDALSPLTAAEQRQLGCLCRKLGRALSDGR